MKAQASVRLIAAQEHLAAAKQRDEIASGLLESAAKTLGLAHLAAIQLDSASAKMLVDSTNQWMDQTRTHVSNSQEEVKEAQRNLKDLEEKLATNTYTGPTVAEERVVLAKRRSQNASVLLEIAAKTIGLAHLAASQMDTGSAKMLVDASSKWMKMTRSSVSGIQQEVKDAERNLKNFEEDHIAIDINKEVGQKDREQDAVLITHDKPRSKSVSSFTNGTIPTTIYGSSNFSGNIRDIEMKKVKEETASDERNRTPTLQKAWAQATDPNSGMVYYYNTTTGETSWVPPESVPEPVDIESDISSKDNFDDMEKNLAPDGNMGSAQGTKNSPAALASTASLDGWMEATDPNSGNTYYYNRETGESSWEQPGSNSNKDRMMSKSTEGEDSPGPALGREQVEANEFSLRDQNSKEDESAGMNIGPVLSEEISRNIDPNPGDVHSNNNSISTGLSSLGVKEIEGPANDEEEDISAISTNEIERVRDQLPALPIRHESSDKCVDDDPLLNRTIARVARATKAEDNFSTASKSCQSSTSLSTSPGLGSSIGGSTPVSESIGESTLSSGYDRAQKAIDARNDEIKKMEEVINAMRSGINDQERNLNGTPVSETGKSSYDRAQKAIDARNDENKKMEEVINAMRSGINEQERNLKDEPKKSEMENSSQSTVYQPSNDKGITKNNIYCDKAITKNEIEKATKEKDQKIEKMKAMVNISKTVAGIEAEKNRKLQSELERMRKEMNESLVKADVEIKKLGDVLQTKESSLSDLQKKNEQLHNDMEKSKLQSGNESESEKIKALEDMVSNLNANMEKEIKLRHAVLAGKEGIQSMFQKKLDEMSSGMDKVQSDAERKIISQSQELKRLEAKLQCETKEKSALASQIAQFKNNMASTQDNAKESVDVKRHEIKKTEQAIAALGSSIEQEKKLKELAQMKIDMSMVQIDAQRAIDAEAEKVKQMERLLVSMKASVGHESMLGDGAAQSPLNNAIQKKIDELSRGIAIAEEHADNTAHEKTREIDQFREKIIQMEKDLTQTDIHSAVEQGEILLPTKLADLDVLMELKDEAQKERDALERDLASRSKRRHSRKKKHRKHKHKKHKSKSHGGRITPPPPEGPSSSVGTPTVTQESTSNVGSIRSSPSGAVDCSTNLNGQTAQSHDTSDEFGALANPLASSTSGHPPDQKRPPPPGRFHHGNRRSSAPSILSTPSNQTLDERQPPDPAEGKGSLEPSGFVVRGHGSDNIATQFDQANHGTSSSQYSRKTLDSSVSTPDHLTGNDNRQYFPSSIGSTLGDQEKGSHYTSDTRPSSLEPKGYIMPTGAAGSLNLNSIKESVTSNLNGSSIASAKKGAVHFLETSKKSRHPGGNMSRITLDSESTGQTTISTDRSFSKNSRIKSNGSPSGSRSPKSSVGHRYPHESTGSQLLQPSNLATQSSSNPPSQPNNAEMVPFINGDSSSSAPSAPPQIKFSWAHESLGTTSTITSRRSFIVGAGVPDPREGREGSKMVAGRIWASFAWIITFLIPNKCIMRPTKMAKQAWREKVALFVIMITSSVLFVGVFGFLPLMLCEEDTIFSQREIWLQAGESWVVVHGIIYDIKDLINRHPGGVKGISNCLGNECSHIFPRAPPVTLPEKCLDMPKVKAHRLDIYSPVNNFTNPVCPRLDYMDDLLGVKCHTFAAGTIGATKYIGEYERGIQSRTIDELEDLGLEWLAIRGRVYDVTDYVRRIDENRKWTAEGKEISLDNNPAAYLFPTLNKLITNSLGMDGTQLYDALFGTPEYLYCMEEMFYAGLMDEDFDTFCYTLNIMMYCMLIFVASLMIIQFVASLIFVCPRHRTYTDEDVMSPVMIMMMCYNEGDNELRKGIKSVMNTSYPDENKVLVVLADGLVTGNGESMSTPEHLANILGFDINHFEDDAYLYHCIGLDFRRNCASVYHGILQKGHKFLKYIVVVKCGLPGEATKSPKPGNRGKRDSQLIIMDYYNRIHYGRELTELDSAIQRAMFDLNLEADMIRFLLTIDADTRVETMAINHMTYGMHRNEKVVALCGETKVDNKASSWVTMVQVFEYYCSHHLKKAFEAAFGCVTCLPGCFTMYRVIADDGTPLLPGDGILYEYSRSDIDSLHEKNLYHLGEDRLLTTLLLKYHPDRSLTFIPEASCWTIVPHTFRILLSQRRRWINSTMHNMFELLFVNMRGVCCMNMKVMVFIDLIATMILPASYIYSVYLFFLVFFDHLPVSSVLLVLYGVIMGVQVVVFILRSRWEYIWWFFIYFTIGLPIFYVVLPTYAFWNMDDFSWGKTRAVGGGAAAAAGDSDGEESKDSEEKVREVMQESSVESCEEYDENGSLI